MPPARSTVPPDLIERLLIAETAPSPEECRRQAARRRHEAAKPDNEPIREPLLRIARQFDDLANRAGPRAAQAAVPPASPKKYPYIYAVGTTPALAQIASAASVLGQKSSSNSPRQDTPRGGLLPDSRDAAPRYGY